MLIVAIPILLGGFLQACGGGSSSAPVTNLKSLTIDPVNSSIAIGTKVQLHATGTFENKTTKDVTESVTWGSADPKITTVSNAAGSKGLATGGAVGATIVAVELQGVKGVSTSTVTQASLKSITVMPVNPVVAKGTTVQMAAFGNFSDGSVQNLSTQVGWSSANSSIAQVSNASGTQGLVTGLSAGNTPITATFNGIQGATTVTVTAATLTAITITVPVAAIAKGTTVQLTATCNFSDGTTQDCTNQVSWTSGNSGIAQVSDTAPSKGLVTGVGVGNTTVSGSLGGIQGSETATVTAATLTSITITGPVDTIAKGTTAQLTATGNFTDGSTQDLTTQVSWISGDDTIAQVSNVAGTQGLVTGLNTGNTTISANLNGIEGSATLTVGAATLTSITITGPVDTIAKGTTAQLTATGNFTDGSTQDLTTQVSWISADDTIAQVSNVAGTQGLVTGLNTGNTTISANLNGIEGSATVTVSAATLTSITITGPVDTIAKGTTAQLTATGNFTDGTTEDLTSQVSWTSADNSIAQVSNVSGSEGLVTGIKVGATTIMATLNGIVGSATVTVSAATLSSITITGPVDTIAKGTTAQLTATGNFTDGSTQDLTSQVSWTSADNSIAQVSNVSGSEGLVTGINLGNTTISANLNGIVDSATVTVSAATLTSITITGPVDTIAKGTTAQLTATGNFTDGSTQDLTNQVSWTSADNSIAQVSNVSGGEGLVTGINLGNTTIMATLNGIVGSATVTVSAATLSSITITGPVDTIAKGTTAQLTATGNFTDGTTEDLTSQVSWTSADNSIAQVSNVSGSEGLVTGINLGNTTIMATLNGIVGSATVTVSAATLSSITITVPVATIAKGTTTQLTATGNFTDGSTQDLTNLVGWTSADNTIAQVSDAVGSKGLVTGINLGTTTIMATLNGIVGSATVTVSAATLTSITITPPDPSIAKGLQVQLTAIGNFTDGSTQNLTHQVGWTSAANAIAQVSNRATSAGLVTGINPGTTTIKATGYGIQGSTTVTVTAATLTSIAVTPTNPSIAKGTTVQLTATGTFSDGTMQNLTQVSWTSAAGTIATVDPNGLVTGTGVGSAAITATQGAVSGSTTVTVTAAVVTSIAVTPANPSIAKGTTVPLTATCTLSDSTTQNCTTQVDWTSGSITIAQVSNVAGTQGVVTGLRVGSTSIIATLNGISGSTTVTVTAAVLTSITITPVNPTIPPLGSRFFTATANFSDGTTQIVTLQTSWISSNPAVGIIFSSNPPSTGFFQALLPGTTTITATFEGLQDSTLVTVGF